MARGLALTLVGIFVAAATRLLGDELKAWMPWVMKRLLDIAIQRLPEDQRERFAEEWSSHIDEIPGDVGKIVTAGGCILAARQIASPFRHGETLPSRTFKRCLDVAASVAILFLVAPVMLMVIGLLKLEHAEKSVFSREKRIGADGRPFVLYRFRLGFSETLFETPAGRVSKKRLSRLGRLLWQSSLHELPQFLNVLRGEMTLVGAAWPTRDAPPATTPSGYLDLVLEKSQTETPGDPKDAHGPLQNQVTPPGGSTQPPNGVSKFD